jgi:hypothetical protein
VARIQDPAHPAYGKAGRDRGVFAAAAIPENTVLGVYVGACVECEVRGWSSALPDPGVPCSTARAKV